MELIAILALIALVKCDTRFEDVIEELEYKPGDEIIVIEDPNASTVVPGNDPLQTSGDEVLVPYQSGVETITIGKVSEENATANNDTQPPVTFEQKLTVDEKYEVTQINDTVKRQGKRWDQRAVWTMVVIALAVFLLAVLCLCIICSCIISCCFPDDLVAAERQRYQGECHQRPHQFDGVHGHTQTAGVAPRTIRIATSSVAPAHPHGARTSDAEPLFGVTTQERHQTTVSGYGVMEQSMLRMAEILHVPRFHVRGCNNHNAAA